jgi:uncharacterized protein
MLREDGHEVVTWRHSEPLESAAKAWTGLESVIHLAGENIAARRWSPQQKQRIRASRVDISAALSRALLGLKPVPQRLLCASAIGWYGSRGDEILTEQSPPGTGFLAEVCREWEAASVLLAAAGTHVTHLRFGMILARSGGALGKMLPIFRAGLGGRVGSGRQWTSWISLADVVGALRFGLTHTLNGAINVVAPNPVQNADFSRQLAGVLRRPCVLPVPAPLVRLAFGEMGEALLLASQRVLPQRLAERGYEFHHSTLEQALTAVLAE